MGEWRFGLAGSYVFDLVNKVTPIAPDLDVIDTYGNPVKHRLVASVDYQRPALEVSTFLNYIGSYRNTLATPSTAIDSWVTLDMRVAVPVSSWLPSLKEGSEVALSVLNVGNSTPPSALNTDVPIGFDPANSDPFGRTVALELVARW
jgi:outer membrane receptor protein involved in Fe transport